MSYGGNPYGDNYAGGGGGSAGGGFVASQGDGSQGAGKQRSDQTLRPVMIYQIENADHPHPDAGWQVDGVDLDQVTLVGVVRNVNQGETNWTFVIEDGTGSIEVKLWKDNASDDTGTLEGIETNVYIRVLGGVKTFGGKVHISSSVVKRLEDHNEWLMHKLECIWVHLQLTRGAADGGQGGGAAGAANGGPAKGTNENYDQIKDPVYKRIYGALLALIENNPDGVHTKQLMKHTGASEEDVEAAREFFDHNGMIFTGHSDEYILPVVS